MLKPLIVVPSAMTAVLTMLNASSFLQDARHVSSDELKRTGARKEGEVTISRRLTSGAIAKYVVSSGARMVVVRSSTPSVGPARYLSCHARASARRESRRHDRGDDTSLRHDGEAPRRRFVG